MRIFAADIGGTYSRFGLFETESSAAGLRESHVHDVIITKEAPNYRVEN